MKSKPLPRINARPREYSQVRNPQMQMNLERSAKVYPHRLVTPKGTGNYREFGNLGRGEA